MAEISANHQDTTSAAPWADLKARIKQHYDLCSSYYQSLWGEHIHHGYFVPEDLSKEEAQIELIRLLIKQVGGLDRAGIRVLDVGCGIGGTSRFLAREYGCHVTGISISDTQVQMARTMSGVEGDGRRDETITVERSGEGQTGSVRFVELDAEKMGEFFGGQSFDIVFIMEALSHFPNKTRFFQDAAALLHNGNEKRLVLADWFKKDGLTSQQFATDIAPIESRMLLPPLCTMAEYLDLAKSAGLDVLTGPTDISKHVAKTWDLSVGLVADPKLWALALTQGRDFIAFLRGT